MKFLYTFLSKLTVWKQSKKKGLFKVIHQVINTCLTIVNYKISNSNNHSINAVHVFVIYTNIYILTKCYIIHTQFIPN